MKYNVNLNLLREMAEEHRRFLATVESEEGTLRHVDKEG